MKKVVCNVLYDTKLPVVVREIATNHELNLGIFDDKKVALISSEILTRIFDQVGKDEYGVMFVSDCRINELLVPESKMNNPLISERLIGSVDEFVKRNNYVVDYTSKKGQRELQEIIGYAKERIAQTCAEDEEVLGK